MVALRELRELNRLLELWKDLERLLPNQYNQLYVIAN